MRDFHSQLRSTPFLDGLRERALFIPGARAQGHHQYDSLNAEMTGRWTARYCDSRLTPEGFQPGQRCWLPETLLETLARAEYDRFTCIGFDGEYDLGSYASVGMENYWLRDEPERRAQFSHPARFSLRQWLSALRGSKRFYAHIVLRDTHRPWGDEAGLFGVLGWPYRVWHAWRKRWRRPCNWPQDAYIARRAALERPDEFAAHRRRGLARADRTVRQIFEATRDREDVTYVVYSNHGEVLDHFRYNQPYKTMTRAGLRLVDGTSHGPFPYEVLYASMQMWLIPGQKPGWMRGLGRLIDFAPTVLELAGLPPGERDGESMLAHFAAGAFPARERHAETPGSPGCLSMVREDQMKLIARSNYGSEGPGCGFADHTLAVFDLAADPYEQVNLLGTRAGRDMLAWAVARHAELKSWP